MWNLFKCNNNLYFMKDFVLKNEFINIEKVGQILNITKITYYNKKKYKKAYKIYENILTLLGRYAKENLNYLKQPVISMNWMSFLKQYSSCLLNTAEVLYMLKKYHKAYIYSAAAVAISPNLDDEFIKTCEDINTNSLIYSRYIFMFTVSAKQLISQNLINRDDNIGQLESYLTSKKIPS